MKFIRKLLAQMSQNEMCDLFVFNKGNPFIIMNRYPERVRLKTHFFHETLMRIPTRFRVVKL